MINHYPNIGVVCRINTRIYEPCVCLCYDVIDCVTVIWGHYGCHKYIDNYYLFPRNSAHKLDIWSFYLNNGLHANDISMKSETKCFANSMAILEKGVNSVKSYMILLMTKQFCSPYHFKWCVFEVSGTSDDGFIRNKKNHRHPPRYREPFVGQEFDFYSATAIPVMMTDGTVIWQHSTVLGQQIYSSGDYGDDKERVLLLLCVC